MILGIYANKKRDIDYRETAQCIDICSELGISVVLSDSIDRHFDCEYSSNELLGERTDVLIVFGGDGTMLKAVREVNLGDTPVLGINLGKLGFLTESDMCGLRSVLMRVKDGNYDLDVRGLMTVVANGICHNALNEVSVSRGEKLNLLELSLFIDEVPVDRYYADGLLVSTPTGSTAYNLAAGGPVLSPDVRAFSICAICPHSLTSRPIVVADSHVLRISCERGRDNATIFVDGKPICDDMGEEGVIIRRSTRTVRFIRLDDTNFYARLKTKLN